MTPQRSPEAVALVEGGQLDTEGLKSLVLEDAPTQRFWSSSQTPAPHSRIHLPLLLVEDHPEGGSVGPRKLQFHVRQGVAAGGSKTCIVHRLCPSSAGLGGGVPPIPSSYSISLPSLPTCLLWGRFPDQSKGTTGQDSGASLVLPLQLCAPLDIPAHAGYHLLSMTRFILE